MTNEVDEQKIVDDLTTITLHRTTLLRLAKIRYENRFTSFDKVILYLLDSLNKENHQAMRSGTLPIKAPWEIKEKLNLP